jgi:hypothetical protein
MLKGELSNWSAPTVGVDYRLLVRSKKELSKFESFMSKALLGTVFEESIQSFFKKRKFVDEWSRELREVSIVIYSIGVLQYALFIEDCLEGVAFEFTHFESVDEFREWIRVDTSLLYVFSSEKSIQTLDGRVRYCEGLPNIPRKGEWILKLL